MSRCEDVLGDDSLPDEMLFGRAGYLWSLLFVKKYLGDTAFDTNNIGKVS